MRVCADRGRRRRRPTRERVRSSSGGVHGWEGGRRSRRTGPTPHPPSSTTSSSSGRSRGGTRGRSGSTRGTPSGSSGCHPEWHPHPRLPRLPPVGLHPAHVLLEPGVLPGHVRHVAVYLPRDRVGEGNTT